jgi:hypothetical protein
VVTGRKAEGVGQSWDEYGREDPYSLSLIGLCPFITMYNPSISQHCHFRPEDGGSMYLQNISMYLEVCMAPKPASSSSLL